MKHRFISILILISFLLFSCSNSFDYKARYEAGKYEDIIENAKEQVVKMLDIKEGDKIIITGGFPIKKTRSTNFMKIENL